MPKLRDEIETELSKVGLNQEMIRLLFKENKINEFKELLKILPKLLPVFSAKKPNMETKFLFNPGLRSLLKLILELNEVLVQIK